MNSAFQSETPSFLSRLMFTLKRRYQGVLDTLTPLTVLRWVMCAALFTAYALRVYLLQGFYIVTYGLGIFLLNLLIGFLSPLEDVEADGPLLPTANSDEFKPFVRRLPEFKFWLSCMKAGLCAFAMTFFEVFNVPVFWPILLIYFIILFFLTMKRQIKHMIKYKYLPFSLGKKTYGEQGSSLFAPVGTALPSNSRSQ